MLKKILIGVAVLIAVLLVVIATRPDTFHIERVKTMPAPPAAVFAVVNDLHRWGDWSPWDKLDPNMKKDWQGGPGVGAQYHWAGNDKVGEGRMTIKEAQAPDKIVIRLEFIKPFPADNLTTFTFVPDGSGTKVTWSLDGHNNFMSKAFGMFVSMDQMVGKDFESGLESLSLVSLAEAKKMAADEAAKQAAAQPSPSPAPLMPEKAPENTAAPAKTPEKPAEKLPPQKPVATPPAAKRHMK